jgi:hypothetical protein
MCVMETARLLTIYVKDLIQEKQSADDSELYT